jgi:hypothetical protein
MASHTRNPLRPILAAAALACSLMAAGDAQALFGSGSSKDKGEYIILSGGPALRQWENLRQESQRHDRWWGNFIRPARVRIEQLQKQHGSAKLITWLVYRPCYESRATEDGKPLISWIESVRDKYGIRLVWINSGADVVNYINSGLNRSKTKVSGFVYYGHSNRHAFMMDYSNDISGASTAWLHEVDLQKLKRSSFTRRADCRSYGCHTGESMSAKWRKATGTKLWGATGKTDYSDPTNPSLSPGAKWTR